MEYFLSRLVCVSACGVICWTSAAFDFSSRFKLLSPSPPSMPASQPLTTTATTRRNQRKCLLKDCWIACAIVLQTNAKILHIVEILCKTEHVMELKSISMMFGSENVELSYELIRRASE